GHRALLRARRGALPVARGGRTQKAAGPRVAHVPGGGAVQRAVKVGSGRSMLGPRGRHLLPEPAPWTPARDLTPARGAGRPVDDQAVGDGADARARAGERPPEGPRTAGHGGERARDAHDAGRVWLDRVEHATRATLRNRDVERGQVVDMD